MKCSRFPEQVDITQTGSGDSFRKAPARKLRIQISQIDNDIPVRRCRRILVSSDSHPGQFIAVICLIGPGCRAALFKLRSFSRKHHMDGCTLTEITFGLMNLEFQTLPIPDGVIADKITADQISRA